MQSVCHTSMRSRFRSLESTQKASYRRTKHVLAQYHEGLNGAKRHTHRPRSDCPGLQEEACSCPVPGQTEQGKETHMQAWGRLPWALRRKLRLLGR